MIPRASGRAAFNVQDYKDKRQAQLDRAKKIREERVSRQPASPEDPPKQAGRRTSIPLTTQPVRNRQSEEANGPAPPIRPPSPRFHAPAPSHSPPSPTNSNGSYGHDGSSSSSAVPKENWATSAPHPFPRADSARNPPPSELGIKVTIGQSDLSNAVVAGIITLEQAEKMWRFFHTTSSSASEPPTTPQDHRLDRRSHVDPIIKQQQTREKLAYQEQLYDQYKQQEPEFEPPRRKKSNSGGWNTDTTLDHHDPPPLDEAPLPAAQKPRGKQRAIPEWNSDATFDAPADPYEAKIKSRFDEKPSHQAKPKPRPQRPSASDAHRSEPDRQFYHSTSAHTDPNQYPLQDQLIEYEEERVAKTDRNAELEVELYASNDVPMAECPSCGRNFRTDRLTKHMGVCDKVFGQKRKQFNMKAQRLDGEALALQRQARRFEKSAPKAAPARAIPKWKADHQAFQQAMRAARGAPEPTYAGGIAPPPPPDSRTECPHCGRKFAEDVAERHIPKCQNIVNKPRGPPVRHR
eukprot:NODE_1148_length_1634_cov_70.164565_g1080_i0.p1 GENE.NODE_1148_length_1634_cov_70.164565_g1080_i0~~NODE_1148_length_1634_cov_70.164565_g1080_i0.p1  ORF type:complete len:537 (-),score=81.60 NODE_1148_length_1634_cov_70.164565_g1080_i0:22-1578(-)